ncbi:MAG: bifunctional 2-polyprenyl-6-hydroxyphenol methylase/3-demethylubiquinol 3-O-methyltransferase UbiG [Alphaproteobacteria bacterium]|nr:bifunctional 2-polyprenyl-6-hydroxyphenol methylase/3-demethylubiquinol 3-O-methyltransferase UbiG [Alphaproteobacteria bacterium]
MTVSNSDSASTSIDQAEVDRFAALADSWWDATGPFRPLHRLNPVRLGYIRANVGGHFGRDERSFTPFQGLRLLDLGCGGGLLSEPMARLGAQVVGADVVEKNVRVARLHATAAGLAIDYVHASAEDLASWGERFDVILNMEVIEHVADVPAFLGACATMLNPGGVMVLATLNRTMKAYGLAILGAEYVLRWLPTGTHDWNKFLRPSELAAALRHVGLTLADLRGVSYGVVDGSWRLSADLSVNYIGLARRIGS